jgi:hypothetical protein
MAPDGSVHIIVFLLGQTNSCCPGFARLKLIDPNSFKVQVVEANAHKINAICARQKSLSIRKLFCVYLCSSMDYFHFSYADIHNISRDSGIVRPASLALPRQIPQSSMKVNDGDFVEDRSALFFRFREGVSQSAAKEVL